MLASKRSGSRSGRMHCWAVSVTVHGDGMVAPSGAIAGGLVAVAGLEVYNIGVYQGALLQWWSCLNYQWP